VAAPIESPSIINTRLLTGPIESSHLATWSIPTSASRRPFGRHVRERRRPHDPSTRLSSSAALGARRRSRRRDALAESARGGEGRGGLKARRRELRSPFAVIHHSACGNNTRGSRGGGGRRRAFVPPTRRGATRDFAAARRALRRTERPLASRPDARPFHRHHHRRVNVTPHRWLRATSS